MPGEGSKDCEEQERDPERLDFQIDFSFDANTFTKKESGIYNLLMVIAIESEPEGFSSYTIYFEHEGKYWLRVNK